MLGIAEYPKKGSRGDPAVLEGTCNPSYEYPFGKLG